MLLRKVKRMLPATSAAALLLGAADAMAEYGLNLPQGVTPISREAYDLHMLIFWVCVAIAVVVFMIGYYLLAGLIANAADVLPTESRELKPHPYGVELGLRGGQFGAPWRGLVLGDALEEGMGLFQQGLGLFRFSLVQGQVGIGKGDAVIAGVQITCFFQERGRCFGLSLAEQGNCLSAELVRFTLNMSFQ